MTVSPALWNGVGPPLGSEAKVPQKRSLIFQTPGLMMKTALTDEEIESVRTNRSRRSFTEQRRNSVLPLQWRITHSSRWLTQVLASEFSLVALLLLLIMVFSKKWLYPSRSRFYQRCPPNVSNKIYTSIHTMSMGLLHICQSGSCLNSESGKDGFKVWPSHPAFGVAKISFILALLLGLILTIWLHLQYVPRLQRLPTFGLIGTILSFCEVTFIFFTLMLFPINLWMFELKRNVSIPIGWGYLIGWMAFILYVICATLCYFNQKHFWSLILRSSSHFATCSSSRSRPAEESLRDPTVSFTSSSQEKTLDPEQ